MVKKTQKKRKKISLLRKLIRLFLPILLILLIVGLGRQIFTWFRSDWNGKNQVTFAIETEEKKILILSLTPAKNIISVISLPKDLRVETPWFGDYNVAKLSLLVKQEKSLEVFLRSLTYYLGMPIDKAILNTDLLVKDFDEGSLRSLLPGLFSPLKSADSWRFHHFLKNRDVVWKIMDLEPLTREESLPDESRYLTVDTQVIHDQFGHFLTDPIVKEENLSIDVLNTGETTGLAQKIARVITAMGGRVVEIGDSDQTLSSDCLIEFSDPKLEKAVTVIRIERSLGCEKEIVDQKEGREIKLLIKNVKI